MRWATTAGLTICVSLAACHSDSGLDTKPDPSTADEDGGRKKDGGSKDAGPHKGGKDAMVGKGDAGDEVPDPVDGTIDPITRDDCKPGELTADQIAALKKGGAPGSARFTYPYDGTVFPRGIQGPLLAWDKADVSDAVYVHIKASAYEYHGCLKPTGINELQLPDDVWDQAGQQTYGKRDPFTVELTVSSGGKVVGPLSQKWVIARATIKGSVYYNSYSGAGGSVLGGQVYRIPPKGKAEAFLNMECNGCHSLAANGSRITSQTLGTLGRAYDLESGQPVRTSNAPMNDAYSAMYPDGSHYLVGSQLADADVGRSNIASPLSIGTKATMYETDTGNKINMSGVPQDVLMPSFSPDGSLLVFNDYALNAAHGLAMMKYDAASHTASGYKQLVGTDGLRRPGWPFALPDNNAVVYAETESPDFSGLGAGVGSSVTAIAAPYSELMIVDAETGKSSVLAQAMGYADAAAAASGETYLPFGAEELHKNYFPTVSPVAAGGYFWVFFDSLRHYGNKGLTRQLWGTAIDIQSTQGEFSPTDGLYGKDLSHPSFYLPGQNFGTGNHRAFTALDPCKEDGASCESGVDCCSGSCDTANGTPGVCGKVTSCAKTEDRCTTDDECCTATDTCINGFCATIFL